MTLLGASDVRRLADAAGIHPSKGRGQNFVIDGNTIRKIVALAQLPAESVLLEVGPGLGSLTLGLLEAGHHVTAVEIDDRLAALLPGTVQQFAPAQANNLHTMTSDAMLLQRDSVPRPPEALVANLPYNVAVPVLLHCLIEFPTLQRALVMVQQEVADRLAAGPGSKTYGAPSVKARWFGEVEIAGDVSAGVFWPAPRVHSGLVLIKASPPPRTSASRAEVFAVIDILFGQRRKMIRSSLAAAVGREQAATAIAAAGLDPQVRPEQLDLSAISDLAAAVSQGVGSGNPIASARGGP